MRPQQGDILPAPHPTPAEEGTRDPASERPGLLAWSPGSGCGTPLACLAPAGVCVVPVPMGPVGRPHLAVSRVFLVHGSLEEAGPSGVQGRGIRKLPAGICAPLVSLAGVALAPSSLPPPLPPWCHRGSFIGEVTGVGPGVSPPRCSPWLGPALPRC